MMSEYFAEDFFSDTKNLDKDDPFLLDKFSSESRDRKKCETCSTGESIIYCTYCNRFFCEECFVSSHLIAFHHIAFLLPFCEVKDTPCEVANRTHFFLHCKECDTVCIFVHFLNMFIFT